jgi:hypothetical protein
MFVQFNSTWENLMGILEWIGYILARTIAGVLVALIVAAILKKNVGPAKTAGEACAIL